MSLHLYENYFELTLSLHEFLQKVAPVSWFWPDIVHALRVEIGHCVVLCITGNIDYLQGEKTKFKSYLNQN